MSLSTSTSSAKAGSVDSPTGDSARQYGVVLQSAGAPSVKTTRYFREQVMRKRPYLRDQWCEQVVKNPIRTESQPDGRVRLWGYIRERGLYLRVVTLADGETVHNAFFD